MESIWWTVFDVLGTIAFAISGVLVAVSRRMDLFGIFVLSAATAVGGGILRDVLVGKIPPTAFQNDIYISIIVGTIIVTAIVLRYVDFQAYHRVSQYSKHIYLACDAIGLGSFTVTGTLVGISLYPTLWILSLTLGVITAVGGGVIRDVLAGLIPGVLRKEIYATASLLGAMVLYGLAVGLQLPVVMAAMAAFVLTVAIRLWALVYHTNLPRIRRRRSA